MKFEVKIGARKIGAIGRMYVEKRTYVIDAPNREAVNQAAIERAYQDPSSEPRDRNNIPLPAQKIP